MGGGGGGMGAGYWPLAGMFLWSLSELTFFRVYENSRYFLEGIVRIGVRTFFLLN